MQDEIVERLGCFLYLLLPIPPLALLTLVQWPEYADDLPYYADMRLALKVGLGAFWLGAGFLAWGLVKTLSESRYAWLCYVVGGGGVVLWLACLTYAYGQHAFHHRPMG